MSNTDNNQSNEKGDKNADANLNADAVAKEKLEIVSDKDMWEYQLEQNRIARRKESKYFTLEPGETADLEIIEIKGPVEKDFDGDKKPDTIRYEYKIQDLNNLDSGVKIWGLSKTWSEALDFILSQGNKAVRVSRKGSGMQTKYYFSVINVQRSK